jgi:hypothetical protein
MNISYNIRLVCEMPDTLNLTMVNDKGVAVLMDIKMEIENNYLKRKKKF